MKNKLLILIVLSVISSTLIFALYPVKAVAAGGEVKVAFGNICGYQNTDTCVTRSGCAYETVGSVNNTAVMLDRESYYEVEKKYLDFKSSPISAKEFVYNYPYAVILMIVLFFVATVMYIIGALLRYKQRLEMAKSAELSRYLQYITIANDIVAEVDITRGTYTELSISGGGIVRKSQPFNGNPLFIDSIYTEDLLETYKYWNSVALKKLAKEGGRVNYHCRVKQADGSYQWESVVLTGIQSSADNCEKVMIFRRNIDQSRRDEEKKNNALRDALISAERSNQAKSQYVTRVSHEIRTPLNAVLGYTELAKRKCGDEKVYVCLEKSESAAKRLLNLIDAVLELDVNESEVQLNRTVFIPMLAFEGLIEQTAADSRVKGINFNYECRLPERLKVVADCERMEKVLANLLSNAIKFTPSGGTVGLTVGFGSAENGRGVLTFNIDDTGIGMTKQFIENQLFRPFGRADSSVSVAGAGIGMPIAKNLLDIMNGAINVESEPNVGTRFTVTIPVDLQSECEVSGESDTNNGNFDGGGTHGENARDYGGAHVLLVEDNAMNAEIACELLKSANIICDRADNGEAAVKLYSQSSEGFYSAVLMDIQMPIMNGFQATRAIRHLERLDNDVAIVAMTANDRCENIAECFSAGMNDFVAKPISVSILFETLDKYLK